MLEQYLGAERFREGVSHYLKTHAYGNTETSDLWDAIESHAAASRCGASMDSWIWQPGLPADLGTSRRRRAGAATSQRFSFDAEYRCRRRCGSCRSRCRSTASSRTLLLDRRRGAVSRSSDPMRRSSSTPVGTASSASPTTTRCGPDSTGDTLTSADDARALQPRRRRLERGHRRPPRGDRLLDFVEGFADERDLRRVAGDRDRPPRAAAASSTTPRSRRLQQARRAARRPGARRPRRAGGERVRSHRQAPRVAHRRCSRCSATTPPRQARCRELYDRSEAEPGSVDPELVAAATSVVAATGARPTTSGCSPVPHRRRHRRISSGTSMRSPSSTAPS